MSLYQLTIDITFEDEADHDAALGWKATTAGAVEIKPTSTQAGEVCTMIVEGFMPAILAWLGALWQSYGEAIDELKIAKDEDRLKLI